jgi:hypothetical protein
MLHAYTYTYAHSLRTTVLGMQYSTYIVHAHCGPTVQRTCLSWPAWIVRRTLYMRLDRVSLYIYFQYVVGNVF